MAQPLRLFIAIDLPPDVKQLLGDVQGALQRHTHTVRWADPDGTHLTLKFLGAVEAEAVERIVGGLAAVAARHQPFVLQTDRLGVFPNQQRPRIVWLGLRGDVAALEQVQQDVERTIAPLGFPTEARPFRPHLTLGRSDKEAQGEDFRTIRQAVTATDVPRSAAITVNELVLMHSELSAQGARYTPIAHGRLDGAR